MKASNKIVIDNVTKSMKTLVEQQNATIIHLQQKLGNFYAQISIP